MTLALSEVRDRVVASDPGLSRLWSAVSATFAMASALAVEFGFALVTGADAMGTLIAMLLGAVVAMMGAMALGSGDAWAKTRTAAFFPVAFGVGMVAGALVGSDTVLMLTVFVAVMFAAVYVRRFGVDYFFYGFMGWMGYFFAAFLHTTLAMLPGLMVTVIVATVWVLLLSITVLRVNSAKTLARVVRAFDARARAVARAAADLLSCTDPRRIDRLRRRLHGRLAAVTEAALMVEGWSAEPGALPADKSPSRLRRKLIDAQHVLEQLVTAAEALVGTDQARAAARVADRLARRDDSRAAELARVLPDEHFSVAVTEFVALASGSDATTDDVLDEFEASISLAFGALPGSPAVAKDVPARGGHWNPLARLDMTTRQAVQVAVAGALAIIIGSALSPARYYWAVIAAFVLFAGTATRTETFAKGLNRVLGTLFGLIASVLFAALTAGNTAAVLAVIIGSMFLGFYLIRVSYLYMIFFVTIMVGQLYSVLHEFSTDLLLLRLAETAVGATIGFVVALVVTPLSTRDTIRSARDAVLTALAAVLDAASTGLDLDAPIRTLDTRLWQLSLVARPLTVPMLGGTVSPRTRHRLALYASLGMHARALRRPAATSSPLAPACRALADAVRQLIAAPVGAVQPAAEGPLAAADAALFAPGVPASPPLIHLRHVLRELSGIPLGGGAVAGTTRPHAALSVLDRDGRMVASTTADHHGRYHVTGLPPGPCTVLATAFPPTAHHIRLHTSQVARLDITLGCARRRAEAQP
ncbi:FUSC family protein [Kutzneria sp. CA-103260]|uniref:FUSC family protein n=1 Tax=Kutzneria sp. CA-103260 TaxID=2802641 RepID=UPI001BA944B1|nr:FUSC family protein [Kutzneria sp. CA-103260]QUQ66610.1 FUSC family protein [Kutzneria sp. CA-103260]